MFRIPSSAFAAPVVLSALLATSASAATLCVNHTGTAGCWSTISAAVAAAAPGDTILVAASTYNEDVHITKSLSLVGDPLNPPVIDAAGRNNGIFIDGTATAPAPGVANVSIYGFKVEHANFEGILVMNGTNITLTGNHVLNNTKALDPVSGCLNPPAFETNEASDCGEGIHLIGVDHSFLIRNLSENNSGGILVSNETGPSWNNLISGNVVHDNGYACGITLASHGPATSVIPSATLPYPIMHNTISNNESHHNGLLLPGAGAGVGIFAPFPGTTTTANVVSGNSLHDNGLPGVTMHNHAWSPFAPPVNLNDNVIIGNKIWGNAADTADAHTPGTTGIDLYSVAPVTGTIIAQNEFSDESLDIVFSAPAGSTMQVHFNDFNSANTGIANLGAGSIDATNNWWNQAKGPGAGGSTTSGTTITTTPWLPIPYNTYTDPQ